MLRKYPWSPYVAGGISGAILALSVLLVKKFFGTSEAFVRFSAMVTKVIAPSKLDDYIYFFKHPPEVNWKVMFVTGMMIGSFLSAIVSGEFKVEFIPSLWRERIGENIPLRAITAFLGGVLIMIGARLAGGCPSGHGLSGVSTLSAGSFLTMMGFMGGGFLSANIIYRLLRR